MFGAMKSTLNLLAEYMELVNDYKTDKFSPSPLIQKILQNRMDIIKSHAEFLVMCGDFPKKLYSKYFTETESKNYIENYLEKYSKRG